MSSSVADTEEKSSDPVPVRPRTGPPPTSAPEMKESEQVAGAEIDDHHDQPPDGGLQAWLQVLGSWAILADTWGLINTFGVFQTYYERVLLPGVSASDISWIGSLQGALLMIVGPLSGSLYDAGYFRPLLLVGIVLIVLGQAMTSLATEYYQLVLAQGVCIGLGCGLTFLPSTAILSQYFRRRRALVIGLASTGSPLAGSLFPLIFSRLEPAIGFGWTTRVIALVLLVLSIFPALFMRPRESSSSSRAHATPTPTPTPTPGPRPPRGMRSLVDESAFRDVPFLLVMTGGFFAFLTLYVAFFYIELFAVRHGIGPEGFSPYFVTLLNAGSIVGRVGPNYLADKVGPLHILVGVLGASATLMFGWMGIRDFGGLVAFALLYGLFSGSVVSVTPTVVVSLAPDMARVGTRMGMMFFACGLPILFGTPIAGAIVGGYSRAEWRAMIGYGAAGLAMACVFTGLAGIYMRWEKHESSD
ncbi:MFS general substrate transporter [Sodiomyces alkalinus F11]|uniref:MFS general substrate transporter n=1 Tax=Sodiomyces alkalinus (strain CBS 110278 / VKM F-3762 / F11) TaxID=1314773 RepID=A0A3N2PPI5_SODAK|nr:MFS general substrate transporter [Sodiomyces alkalinus F11]ROT36354.1 MFS general substrate transporter [Sodiomyces alkalinus F11]